MARRPASIEAPRADLAIKWNEDLTGQQRGRIASAIESQVHIPQYRWLKTSDLQIDEKYQRAVSMERCWEMVSGFDWRLFGSLWIGERKDGSLNVVDGRHRYTVALMFGPELMPKVPCEIRKTTGSAEEARIFVDLQEKRRAITTWQRFQAKLLYNDPQALEIDALIRRHKFTVTDAAVQMRAQRADNVLNAIGILEQMCAANGAKAVDNVLYTLRHAWDGASITLIGTYLRAMWRVYQSRHIDHRDRFARALSQQDPYSLLDRAARYGHNKGIPHSEALAEVLGEFA